MYHFCDITKKIPITFEQVCISDVQTLSNKIGSWSGFSLCDISGV